jgi:ASC-1-like (ASCH) protein
MEYFLDLNPRPFEAIKNGTKKIECRVPTEHNKSVPFAKLKAGDIIIFTNNLNNEIMKTKILAVRHYENVRAMLKSEGVENVLSSGGNIEQGIKSYHSLEGYKEGVKKFGIYAIEIIKI